MELRTGRVVQGAIVLDEDDELEEGAAVAVWIGDRSSPFAPPMKSSSSFARASPRLSAGRSSTHARSCANSSASPEHADGRVDGQRACPSSAGRPRGRDGATCGGSDDGPRTASFTKRSSRGRVGSGRRSVRELDPED
jgi:hypothetical protein